MSELIGYTAPLLHFNFNPTVFTEDVLDGLTVLSTVNQADETSYATLLLNEEMKKGSTYTLNLRFKLATDAPTLRLYALDAFGESPELMYEFEATGESSERWQELFTEFTAKKAGYWCVGIASDDLTGDHNGLLFDRIVITESDTTAKALTALQKKVDALAKDEEINHYQSTLQFWSTYRRDGESLQDAKIRFFRTLDPPDEETRLLQQTTTLLLDELARICAKHGVDYWIDFGTLLGAVRHGGFVPWDDDIDVCMLRKDIPLLQKAIEEEETFIKFTQYYCIGAGIYNITRVMFDDPGIKLFVDIFIFDYVNTDDFHGTWMEYRRQRRIFCDETRKYRPVRRTDPQLDRWEVNAVIKEEDIRAIDTIREHTNSLLGVQPNYGDYVMWSVDNVGYGIGHYGIRPLDHIYPLTPIDFEGGTYLGPAQPIPVLEGRYGDPFSIPRDMFKHRHIDRKPGFADKCRELLAQYSSKAHS